MDFYAMPDNEAVETAIELDRDFFKHNPEKAAYCRLAIAGEDFGYFPPQTVVNV